MICAHKGCDHEVEDHRALHAPRPPIRVGEANHCTRCRCKGFVLHPTIVAHQKRELDRVGHTPEERAKRLQERREKIRAFSVEVVSADGQNL